MSDIRVLAGDPTAEELALIVALVRQRRREQPKPAAQLWGRPHLRGPLPTTGWWASGLAR